MSQSPYSKVPLQDPGTAPSAPPAYVTSGHVSAPPPQVYDPPPPYEAGNYNAPQGYQPVVGVGVPVQSPPVAYPQPPASVPVVYAQQPPAQVVVAQATTPSAVVVTQTLAPGVCTVCRKGKIQNGRTCCTYFCCLFLCMFGVLPGIIAFFCCCRKPKCSHCGHTV